MPVITLPDGSERLFSAPVTVLDVAESIGKSLAKATLAGEVDGRLVDASHVIDNDARLRIITAKDEDGLEVIRHSSAHLLAQAIKNLFPKAQITIGPVIDDGFYYDIACETHFNEEVLIKVEAEMQRLAKANLAIERLEMPRNEAIQQFASMGEHYKVEIIQDIPEDQIISCYRQGDFMDLCRGPHVPSTGALKAFKLTKIAGAYWRGDSNNAVLQRIYGTAWADKKQLDEYLTRLEEAKRRDHREIAKKMDLFHLQENAPGQVFWHPNGWLMNTILRQFIRDVQQKSGYQEINTPILADTSLWQASGHLEKFGDHMFLTASENRDYAVKPMSCPCHVQVFNHGLKSYRDLPIRFAEFGCCHRNESSGSLHGIMRVRGFTQDDGHIFCTEEQIQSEVAAFIDQLRYVYKALGFEDVIYKLSTRPDERVGDDETWDMAEAALAEALNSKGVAWEMLPGEGAFYGPKIEFSLKDAIGRVWQCGTIQLDFSMPKRLGAEYVAEDNSKKHPVMLHRAILGTFERFLGILLEQYADELPLWLAPVQVVVANISDTQAGYAIEIKEKLEALGVRVKVDLRNEKINYKIREHTIARVPFMLILGDKEMAANTVAVRPLRGEQKFGLHFNEFCDTIRDRLTPVTED